MRKLLLGNIDYESHTTDEGDQFQKGLAAAGWILAGHGYGDGDRDVPSLLAKYRPDVVVVHDKRDWSPDSPGSFRKDIGYLRLSALRHRKDIYKACVLKDAGSVRAYQRAFFEEVGADAAIVYYEPSTVLGMNGWLGKLDIIRTYHSIDAKLCESLVWDGPRRRAVVTGATSGVYPLRTKVMQQALRNPKFGIEVFGHPGYHNRGTHTPSYLTMLSGYCVHIATASIYGFALRKIIESVAVGATPVTNLPASDELPMIDPALVRVRPDASVGEVQTAVGRAFTSWRFEERLAWAKRAWAYYDWRAIGKRLDMMLEAACVRL